MGQAKQRGTREQRIAQAEDRIALELAESRERFRLAEIARKDRLRIEQAQHDGIPLVFVGSRPRRSPLLMAAIVAASMVAPVLIAPPYFDERKK